jgi:hypothetical protein
LALDLDWFDASNSSNQKPRADEVDYKWKWYGLTQGYVVDTSVHDHYGLLDHLNTRLCDPDRFIHGWSQMVVPYESSNLQILGTVGVDVSIHGVPDGQRLLFVMDIVPKKFMLKTAQVVVMTRYGQEKLRAFMRTYESSYLDASQTATHDGYTGKVIGQQEIKTRLQLEAFSGCMFNSQWDKAAILSQTGMCVCVCVCVYVCADLDRCNMIIS